MVHDEAWNEVLAAKASGSCVGRLAHDDHYRTSEMYAFDQNERAKNGPRKREWTAVGATEEPVIRNMTYCLREIAAGRAWRRRVVSCVDPVSW